MTTKVTAIVTGVGGGVGQSIIKGLKLAMDRSDSINYTIVGTDADPQAPGLYRTDEGHVVPLAGADGYIDRLVEIGIEQGADVLIPGHDAELPVISRHRNELERRGGMDVLVSSPESIDIANDKWKTYKFLDKNGFNVPETALVDNVEKLVERVGFPLVVKPRTGSASTGLAVITDEDELERALQGADRDVIIQDYLVPEGWEGNLKKSDLQRQVDEFSTELIVDSDGELVHSLANWRKMKDGVPSVAKVRPYNQVRRASEAVIEQLDILGPANLQSRVTDEGVTFFELNTRFTGSTAVRCVAGFNGPHSMIRNLVLGEAITQEELEFENLVEMRYKNEVYVSEEVYEQTVNSGEARGRGTTYDYF